MKTLTYNSANLSVKERLTISSLLSLFESRLNAKWVSVNHGQSQSPNVVFVDADRPEGRQALESAASGETLLAVTSDDRWPHSPYVARPIHAYGPNGVVVLFNVSAAEQTALLERLESRISEPSTKREIDEARLQIVPDAEEPIDFAGTIFLRDRSIPRLQLVADILAKGLVLSQYETSIAGLFDSIEPLARSLRVKGRAAATGRDLLRRIGDVLTMQQKMVGRVETGEKPELLWDHPELERLYLRLAEEYELRERGRALDRKLDVISRTVETLLSLLQSRTALRVEWYIVALIIAELVLSLYPPSLWH